MNRVQGLIVGVVACLIAFGCAPTPPMVQAPKLQDEQQATSRVRANPLQPLLVEWPAAERARLESRALRGLVAVHYDGSRLEVLPTCTSPHHYGYVSSNLHRDRIVIESRDELGAKLPLSVASLGGKLAQHGRLVVDLAIVGAFTVDGAPPKPEDFEGDCDRATHYVAGITAGAFELRSGSSATMSGGATAAGIGAEAGRERSEELLSRGGDVRACETASRDDEYPPNGCGALLRVELSRFPRPALPAPTDAAGMAAVDTANPVGETALSREPATPTEPPPSQDPFAPTPSSPSSAEGDVWGFIIPGSLLVVGLTLGVILAVTKKDDGPEREPAPTGGLGNTTLRMPMGVSF
ncbi:MAG: hypothetical protein CVU63_00845 [Deltaproteobacteria bacterium HGW-Deltaproteobacteria-20]|nr:MAG: hypothetical protein CVU63_00845 [Deltaproteobacteria bacterium HGW-Deltaproteobacteria-20]